MRYGIALQEGGWVVRDHISGQTVTRPATSEEAQQAVAEWNARCVTRRVEPPVKVDGWGPAGELRGWVVGAGCRPARSAVDARRRSPPLSARHVGRRKLAWTRTPTVR